MLVMKKNILITSISAKVPLIKTVIKSKNKFDKNISVYGADIDKECVGKYFVDFFWNMPKINLLKIDDFISFCCAKNIKYIIPTRDADVLYFSNYKDKLLSNGIYLFSANKDAVEKCFDKFKFYTESKNNLIIPTYTNLQDFYSSRVVVKERFGSGSNNIAINIDRTTALRFAQTLKAAIFQPYIPGKEFSIDSYVNKDGKCIASIVRSRDVVKHGESQITTVVEDSEMKILIASFLEDLNIYGHSVTQVIKYNDTFSIIECNTRFGGASTLSYEMGLESFYWFLLEADNKEFELKLKEIKLKQVRFAEDRYFEC
jgi:carbamoyl-phosphate synthase large subunit